MQIKIPKRGVTFESNGPDGMLELLREDGLLPPASLAEYKAELRTRLASWFGWPVTTDDSMELIRLLHAAGAIQVIVEWSKKMGDD